MTVIGGKLFSNHPKNLNNVHKDSNYLVSFIIPAGKDISGGETVFYDEVKTSDLVSRSHILKTFHKRMIFGTFERIFLEGTLWIVHIAVISFILKIKIFLHFYRHWGRFYKPMYQ